LVQKLLMEFEITDGAMRDQFNTASSMCGF
jgi:hypothetical protein